MVRRLPGGGNRGLPDAVALLQTKHGTECRSEGFFEMDHNKFSIDVEVIVDTALSAREDMLFACNVRESYDTLTHGKFHTTPTEQQALKPCF